MKIEMTRSRIAILLLCATLISSESYSASLRQINRMIKRKEYEGALSELERELPKLRGRDRSKGLLLLARLEKDFSEASDIYSRIIDTADGDEELEARLELAKIRYASGDYQEVIDLLSSVKPRFRCEECYESIYLRALAWRHISELGVARREFQKVDRGPFLEWSYIALAEIDMIEGDIEKAIDRYETIGGSHAYPMAGFKLGECYEILGDRAKAEKAFRTVLHHFPRSLEASKAKEKLRYLGNASARRERREGGGAREEPGQVIGESIVRGTGFTLQLGSFSERENAIRLAEEIGVHISGVRVERAEHSGAVWHRVRIGVFQSREEAEREAQRLERITGHEYTVLPLDI
jgi:tetratricopeptide (TPR) repeat protein